MLPALKVSSEQPGAEGDILSERITKEQVWLMWLLVIVNDSKWRGHVNYIQEIRQAFIYKTESEAALITEG